METPAQPNHYVRIFRRLWRYKGRLLTSAGFSVVIAFLFTSTVGVLKPMGDVLFDKGEGLERLRSAPFFDTPTGTWIADRLGSALYVQRDALIFCVGVILTMGVLKNLLRYFQEYLAGWVGERVVIDLSNDMYSKVQRLSVGFFNAHGTDIISRFVQDCYLVGGGIARIFNRAIREPLKGVGALGVCFYIHWQLTLLALFVFPMAGLLMARVGRSIKKRVDRILKKRSVILSSLEENFHGMRVVQTFGLEGHFEGRHQEKNRGLFEDARQVVHFNSLTSPVMEGMITIIGAGVILYSGMQVLNAQMSGGDFLMFYGAMAAMFDPVKKLSKLNNRLQGSMAAAGRVFDLLDRVPEIADRPDAVPLPPLEHEIRFEQVGFQYQTARADVEDRPVVLTDIDVAIKRGEMLGIVGKTGSGKSTLVSLLPRFYDPTSGRITIDGADIRDVRLADLRSQIAIVTQEHLLWNDTVAQNIRLGRLSATRQEIEEAAEAAHIHAFIAELPAGYETPIGEHGYALSGGQRQRLAIARAILKNPRILILDEATNALDTESESKVQAALDEFVKDRTTFVIAHRLSTLHNADRIVVLAGGRMEAIGTHDELMKGSTVYPALYQQQFAGQQALASR